MMRAGEYEQRHRQQREIDGAVEHHQRDIRQHVCPLRDPDRGDGYHGERDRDRHIDQHQREHAEQHQADRHDGRASSAASVAIDSDRLERFLDLMIDQRSAVRVAH